MIIADTFGTKFAFVFPYRHFTGAVPYVRITNQAMSSTDVTLFIPEFGITDTRTLISGGNVEISVQSGVVMSRVNGLHANKVLRVEATGSVSVVGGFQGTSSFSTTSETFIVLPTNTLGKAYVVAAYDNGDFLPDGISELVVSSLIANTQINIVLGGKTVTTTLTNQYDSYQVFAGQADFPDATDVTGALVHADQHVVVMSGHSWGRVPVDREWNDAMLEQVPPLTNLGTHYVLTPFLTHINGYNYRVIATLCQTTITITPTGGSTITDTLQPGEFYESDSATVVDITSDNPILVAQYCQGGKQYRSDAGDPCMIIIPPTELFSGELYFSTGTLSSEHINIVTECDYISKVYLDNSLLSDAGKLQTSDGSFCVIQETVSTTTDVHYVNINTNTDESASLLVVSYGFGKAMGHGHVERFNMSKYYFKEIYFLTIHWVLRGDSF